MIVYLSKFSSLLMHLQASSDVAPLPPILSEQGQSKHSSRENPVL